MQKSCGITYQLFLSNNLDTINWRHLTMSVITQVWLTRDVINNVEIFLGSNTIKITMQSH